MEDNIYCLDIGTKYLVINIKTLEIISISKSKFIKMGNSKKVYKQFKTGSSYLKRFSPVLGEKLISPTLVTSFKCNYQCNYCYQQDMKKQSERLQPTDIVLVKSFYEEYCKQYSFPLKYGAISIIGGEPLLPENKLTLETIAENWSGNTLQVTTNGTYILEYADFIKKNNMKFKVSIDGIEEVHLKERVCLQANVYKKAMDGIAFLLEQDVETVIISVFNPNNVKSYSAFFDLLESMGWLQNPRLSLAFIPEIGVGCDDINKEYLIKSLQALRELRRIDERATHVNIQRMVPGAINLQSAIKFAEKGYYEPYRCTNLYMPNFCFLPDGEIYICLGMISDSRGCVGRYKPKIEMYHERIEMFRQRRIDGNIKCRDCDMKVFCQGECLATALKKTGAVLGCSCELWGHTEFLEYIEMGL